MIHRPDGKQGQTALERCNVVNDCWLQKIICLQMTCLISHKIAVLFFAPMTMCRSVKRIGYPVQQEKNSYSIDYFANELSLIPSYAHTFELRNGFGYINKENL